MRELEAPFPRGIRNPPWQPHSTNAPVTVWYEATLVETSDGQKTQKSEIIPWTEAITITHAIASAGGYSTPPHRYIYLVRDGQTTLLPDPRQVIKPEDDMRLRPGDRIELRRSQNQQVHGTQ